MVVYHGDTQRAMIYIFYLNQADFWFEGADL